VRVDFQPESFLVRLRIAWQDLLRALCSEVGIQSKGNLESQNHKIQTRREKKNDQRNQFSALQQVIRY